MPEDVDARIAAIIMEMMRLSRLLPPEDLDSLLGAVSVELETGMEVVEERRFARRPDANVVTFPGPRSL